MKDALLSLVYVVFAGRPESWIKWNDQRNNSENKAATHNTFAYKISKSDIKN